MKLTKQQLREMILEELDALQDPVVNERKKRKMSDDAKKLLKQKGYTPIFNVIKNSKRDLKKRGYSRDEIKDTLYDMFGDEDPRIVLKIEESAVNESVDMDVKVLNDSNPESLKAVVDGKQTTLSLENAEVLELVKGRFAEGIATYSSQDFQDHVFEFKVNLSLHGLEFDIVEVEELHQVIEA